MTHIPLLSDSLYDLVFWLPQRLRLQHNSDTSHFVFQVFLKNKWRNVYELDSIGCHPIELLSDFTLEYALRQEIEGKGWFWTTGLAAETNSDGILYTAQVSKEKSFLYSPLMSASSSAHALGLAVLAAVRP